MTAWFYFVSEEFGEISEEELKQRAFLAVLAALVVNLLYLRSPQNQLKLDCADSAKPTAFK